MTTHPWEQPWKLILMTAKRDMEREEVFPPTGSSS